jgi:hypothetical protein
MDHQWRAAVLHLCFNPCRALPVAHPGCPMDHFQTLVNKSPGDLWMRFIGSIYVFFCYLALGNEILKNKKPGGSMAVSSWFLSFFSLWRNYAGNSAVLFEISPLCLGHPHSDNDVLPGIRGIAIVSRPPGGTHWQKRGHYFTK